MTSPLLHSLTIALGERSYPIQIGSGLLADAASFADLPKASAALIVSNSTVAPLYAPALQAALQPHYASVHLVVLPDGEAHKDCKP
jgi:3-dehydroquinate synthase